jgi:hypothetical protein
LRPYFFGRVVNLRKSFGPQIGANFHKFKIIKQKIPGGCIPFWVKEWIMISVLKSATICANLRQMPFLG